MSCGTLICQLLFFPGSEWEQDVLSHQSYLIDVTHTDIEFVKRFMKILLHQLWAFLRTYKKRNSRGSKGVVKPHVAERHEAMRGGSSDETECVKREEGGEERPA